MPVMSSETSDSKDAHRESISDAHSGHENVGVPCSSGELSSAPGSPAAKEVAWSEEEEEEEEKVCRVCCCQEPDPAGEEALAVLEITSHIPLLEEQFEEARRRRSLSRDSVKGLRPTDSFAAIVERPAPARGSFRGLAADLARRIFQKEEGPAAGDGGPALRRASSLSCGVPQQGVLRSWSLPRPGAEHGVDLEQGVKPSERLPKQTAKPTPEAIQDDIQQTGSVGQQAAEAAAPPGPMASAPASEAPAGDPPAEVVPGMPRGRSQLLQLGCHCQGDLALCHYACFLRWVVSRGPSAAHCDNQCEICGQPATSVSQADINTINSALRHRRRLTAGQREGRSAPVELLVPELAGGDPSVAESEADARALIGAAAWFDPLNRGGGDARSFGRTLQVDRAHPAPAEVSMLTHSTRWAVEILGVALATALLTLTLSRLFVDVLPQNQVRFGLHYILSAIIAFVAVIWFRVVAIPRLRSGPARSGAIVMCIWLMVLGVWFSGTKPPDRTSGSGRGP
ncbi:hypothetical protein KFL_002090010 [Klebsormidium nitens]|uniref:RING-CH-type domain-containing protein n=1 Tax=Klebsormidium nitens TaxID=105231 RepID=A0A1Y1I613_KLENI|nr:hypothetical protein KFL_002090010 [Klebsormidium nitens]|eukprot:GAQ84849.1 hypothetical protein KFL_002090010 [Klebsormidium nitens]